MSEESNFTTKYYFSKGSIIITAVLLIILAPLFLAIVAGFLFSATSKDIYDSTYGWLIIIFFGVMSVVISFLLFTISAAPHKEIRFSRANEPLLILTKDELIDNINEQRFFWKEIATISLINISFGRTSSMCIAISLIAPGKYITSTKNLYKRFTIKWNLFFYKCPFLIAPGAVNVLKMNY